MDGRIEKAELISAICSPLNACSENEFNRSLAYTRTKQQHEQIELLRTWVTGASWGVAIWATSSVFWLYDDFDTAWIISPLRTGQVLLSELSQCRFGRKATNVRGSVFVPRSSPSPQSQQTGTSKKESCPHLFPRSVKL